MFGYVRPALNLLSKEEQERYREAYCGLCHAMGKRHGLLARFTLNYDLTFLALLHYGGGGCGEIDCRRCPAHPLRKAKKCICGPALDAAADESMILTWYKLADDVADHGFLAGLPARFGCLLFRGAYRRASSSLPEFDRLVRENMLRLSKLEEYSSPQLDRAADTFAGILAAAAGQCADSVQKRVTEQLLYHLGRWIYLVDAWDDLAEDRKKNRYNPLDARFEGEAEAHREEIETTMTHSASLMAAAANLLNFGEWTCLVDNVIFHSMPAIQKAVLAGKWKEMRRQGRRTHERSV